LGKLIIITFSLMLAGCARATTPTSIPTSELTIALETRLTAAERATIFDSIWQTVNDKYFDPSFGGKDWQAIGDEYRLQLTTVHDDGTFWFQVVNPMLFELGVSHIGALPAELSGELDSLTFATGSLGMDVRMMDGLAVITQVTRGSPAEKAGLRPGFVVSSVDGRTPRDFPDFQTPPDNERNRRRNAVSGIRSAIYGEVETEVVIEYLDANDRTQSATLQFALRTGVSCGQLDPSLPPACTEFEVQRLANGIGYIRFSGFLETVLDSVLQAIDDLQDAPALIIDLRGNPGGQFPVRKAIASQLVGEPKLFMRYRFRDGVEKVYLNTVTNAYPGVVVILVDELSQSSSEEFTGSLQALDRATIIGSQTPGSCLVMELEVLHKGAILIYPYAQPQTRDGQILEDNGVVPDIEIALDREQLLQGIDGQLEAAIEYVEEKMGN
jgi:carboxyl-terminal processing protease